MDLCARLDNQPSIEQPYEGQKFKSFDALKKYLEEYGQKNYVKFWIRSSHTRNSLKSKISKTMNPDLKYVCVKFACIFGGEKIRCRGSGIRKSSTYRDLGCPCMINAVVGEDGNHVKLDTVILEHNHVLCKTLYDSLKKTKRKSQTIKNNKELMNNSESLVPSKDLNEEISYMVVDSEYEQQDKITSNGICYVEDNSDTSFSLKCETSDNCLENIQDKYGKNIKILVVNSDSRNNKFDDLLKFNEKENGIISDISDKQDKNDICRLCLSSTEQLSPIFNPDLPLKSTVLSFKIMGCASIEVSSNDGLPNSICTTCEADLEIAYKFRIQCENSDSFLRKTYLQKQSLISPETLLLKQAEKNLADVGSNEEINTPNETLVDYHDEIEDSSAVKKDAENFGTSEDSLFVRFAITCPICGSEHETYESMLDHLETHAESETLVPACNICEVMCATIKDLQNHMRNHLSQIRTDEYGCSHCDMTFPTPEEVKSHEISHTKKQADVNYFCNVCGKILKTKDRFRSHKNTHEGLRPHVCLKCGRGFADRKNMHHHYNVVHLRKPKLECPVCQKKFYARTKMKSHVTMHYGVKPFFCDVCGKTFRLKMNMIKHKKTHSNDRPHKCDKCNAAFIDKNMLRRHSYVHGGVRPYPCPVCGHRFSVKFHLKKHLEKSKCSDKALVVVDDYQWVGMTSQSESDLPGTECVVVYKTNEDVLQPEQEPITMNILQEYQEEPVT
ncbi:hypothetical protein RUM44_002193 [Polyplax serrata]|uniref:Uncharacterized protein n=1 Tax=Polyplax serrata TaxID=468196 RepID=A0ABR1AM59_POLSC